MDPRPSTTLYARLRTHEIVGQFVRYAVIGLLNVTSFLAIFNALLFIGGPPLAANAAGFLLTSISSFFLNKLWTFGDRRRQVVARQYLVFVFFTLIGLAMNLILFSIFLIPLRRFGTIGTNLAALAPLPFTVMWNFTSYRLWTFRPRSEDSDVAS